MKIETGIKHTPGPWTIQRDYRYDQDAFSIEKRGSGLRSVIALTNDSWLCDEHGDLVKNTRLLAAAPDLLEACQTMLDAFKKSSGVPISLNQAYANMMQQVQKATK